MPRSAALFMAIVTGTLLSACVSGPGQGDHNGASEAGGNSEEVYVFRTARTRHQRGPTPTCAAAPFSSANEDYYELWSIALDARNSRVMNARGSAVGGFTACLGQLAVGQPVPMYATGTVARIPWKGVGECLPLRSQPPIRTAIAFTCRLDLSGLPASYTGGFLVSSTLAPLLGANQPADAHVPGYLSTSVVSVRLWKSSAGRDPN